jgi:hypothetical protein
MASGRRLTWIGILLLVVGTIGYGGGFFYGLRFAYRPEDNPEWLGPLFPVCLVAGALGLLLLVSGLIVSFKIRG